MKFLQTTVAKHTAMAIGAGAYTCLAGLTTISPNEYVKLACASGLATLTALGVGIAKRSDPS